MASETGNGAGAGMAMPTGGQSNVPQPPLSPFAGGSTRGVEASGSMTTVVRGATNGLCTYGRRLEDTLANFAALLDRHTASISNIETDLRTRCFNDDLNALRVAMEDRFDRLERRMEALEGAVVVRAPGSSHIADPSITHTSLPIGEYVAAQQAQLERMSGDIAERPTRDETMTMIDATAQQIGQDVVRLQQEKASAAHVRAMQVTQQETLAQLRAVEANVQVKMDRVELRQLESAVESIRDFDKFRDDVGATLKSQEQKNKEFEEALGAENDTLGQLSNMVGRLANDLPNCAQRSELEGVRDAVRQVAADVATKAPASGHESVDAGLAELTQRVEQLQVSLQSQLQTHVNKFDSLANAVDNHAGVADLRQQLDGVLGAVEQRLQKMEGEVANKAFVTTVAATEQTMVNLAARQEDLQRQIEIALRFVEWFSRRGEAYEYNAAAIEKHMKDLALSSHSRRAGVPRCDGDAGSCACGGGSGCTCGCGSAGGGGGGAKSVAFRAGSAVHTGNTTTTTTSRRVPATSSGGRGTMHVHGTVHMSSTPTALR